MGWCDLRTSAFVPKGRQTVAGGKRRRVAIGDEILPPFVIFTLSFLALFGSLLVVFAIGVPLLTRLITWAGHRSAAFRYRDYVPVFVVLAVGLAAAIVAGDAFIDIAERVQSESPRLHAIDHEVHSWAADARTDGSTTFFTLMTVIGTPVGLGVIVVLFAIALLARGRWQWATYLFLTCAIGGLLNLQLKAWFARARPDLAEALRHASGYSFPSGHAMGSMVVFGALSYLALRAIHHARWRAVALAFATTMTIAIATSRIYLGVHWISDVGAGLAAGLIWVCTTTVAYETFRRIRLVRAMRKRATSHGPSSDPTALE